MRVRCQCWYIIVGLSVKVLGMTIHFPGYWITAKHRTPDPRSWAVGGGEGSGLEREDSSGQDVQAPLGRRGPPGWLWMHRRGGGARSYPSVISPGWGLSTLRLLWNSSRDWTLHHSCIRSQCRRCLGILSWRVASGSPGCASAISGRGTGLTLGPG